MATTLNWYPDRGFELDLDAASEDIKLRMVAVPVPADGTEELRAGVELDRLEILFKAQADVHGEPGQVTEARVRLVEENGLSELELDVRIEDVETGGLLPFQTRQPVCLPPRAPTRGGPRPQPADEDELDWEDETTLEQMVVAPVGSVGGDTDGPAPERELSPLEALRRAVASLDEEEEEEEVPVRPAPKPAPPPAAPPGDQLISREEEAAGLLRLLIDRDALELEEDHELDELVPGVVRILAGRGSAESKAGALSAWLLEQPAVADLFADDDELTEILEQW